MAPELVAGAAPQFAGEQLVMQAAAAGHDIARRGPRAGHGRGRAWRPARRVRYLAVPVARDDRGGLVVDELPSLVPGPARARAGVAGV